MPSQRDDFHLLVIDAPAVTTELMSTVEQQLSSIASETSLDVVTFVDDVEADLEPRLRRYRSGQTRFVRGKTLLDEVGDTVRESISDFVAGLRLDLEEIAYQTGGPRWGRRFGELWWFLQVAEKNCQADGVWWDCVRLAAVRRQMAAHSYSQVAVAGRGNLGHLVSQLCRLSDVEYAGHAGAVSRSRWLRLLGRRVLSGLLFLVAVTAARPYRARGPAARRVGLLVYTWIDFWRPTSGRWIDQYYGRALEEIEQDDQLDTVCALGIYGLPAAFPEYVWTRFRRLWRADLSGVKHVVLQSEISPWWALKEYGRVDDAVHYWRMTRSRRFAQAFAWDGIDTTTLFGPMMWESVLTGWPFLECQRKCAERVARRYQPRAALLYVYEYRIGQALIAGVRRAGRTRVIGMQHGVMAKMNLINAGRPEESKSTERGGPPRPEPDCFCVDGPFARGILLDRGLTDGQIQVVGAARSDEVWRAAIRTKHRASPARTRVLVAPGLHDTDFVVRLAVRSLSREPVSIVLKSHPKVSTERLRRSIASCFPQGQPEDVDLTVVSAGDIHTWMMSSTICIASYSAAAIEAVMFGLAVVLLVSDRQPDMGPLSGWHDSVVLTAGNEEALRRCVRHLTTDKDFHQDYVGRLRELAPEILGPTDGGSAARLARCCHEQTRLAEAMRGHHSRPQVA